MNRILFDILFQEIYISISLLKIFDVLCNLT